MFDFVPVGSAMTGNVVDDDDQERRITALVDGILLSRGPLDQTKGMIMVIYGIDDEEAFHLIRAQARRTNSKLHAFAKQFRDDVAALGHGQAIPPRATFDVIFRTVHERIPSDLDGAGTGSGGTSKASAHRTASDID